MLLHEPLHIIGIGLPSRYVHLHTRFVVALIGGFLANPTLEVARVFDPEVFLVFCMAQPMYPMSASQPLHICGLEILRLRTTKIDRASLRIQANEALVLVSLGYRIDKRMLRLLHAHHGIHHWLVVGLDEQSAHNW